jgi:alanine racemase
LIVDKFGPNDEAMKLESPATIGVTATGLHDGLLSAHSKGGKVLVRGKMVKVWGPVSLEHTVIDLSNCPEARPGDEVVIVGRQGDEEITMDEILKLWKVSLIQLLAHLNIGMSRVYLKNGKPVGISTKLGYHDL